MNPTVLKTLFLAAGLACLGGCQPHAVAAATLVRDVRVFDGNQLHERRSVLFENGVIRDVDFRIEACRMARDAGWL